jgi:hypothetical protein
MDVQAPAPKVAGVDNPKLHGILRLGGALRPPTSVPPKPPDIYETWDVPFPRPIQEDLARLINLPDDYRRKAYPDPVIAPPLYGRWHAFAPRVLRNPNGSLITPTETWVQRLNLDPRFRVAAGIGTRVIQDNQERYMDAAWQQVGDVLRALWRIRLGQLGMQVSRVWYERFLVPLLGNPQRAFHLTAPVHRRVLTDGVTVRHAMTTAHASPTMASAPLRRIIRPRGRLVRLLPVNPTYPLSRLLERVNAGEVSAARPKPAPSGLLTADKVADRLGPSFLPAAVRDWIRRRGSLAWWVLVLAILVALVLLLCLGTLLNLAVAATVAVVVIALGLLAFRTLKRWRRALLVAEAIVELTPQWVDRLPGAAGFALNPPGTALSAGRPARRGPDSIEAVRFKQALRKSYGHRVATAAAGQPPQRRRLDLPRVAGEVVRMLDPSHTIARRMAATVHLPEHIRREVGPGFVEPMAYPVIDQPMYEPLRDLGPDLFLPNLNLIEVNSLTLLEPNQRFIESYMVGVNHEFARELLWREYPTDQRGTPFRQFWDVRGFFNSDNLDDDILRERLRDIPPLHKWKPSSELGKHDNREASGVQEDELVLVIRGELLKRYPTAVIYAHRAKWQLTQGSVDKTKERQFLELSPTEQANPPRDKILTPLYEAKVEPDIYLFGFDLTAEKAKGSASDPGWFFVIKERPGEPRFGLDTDKAAKLQVWNDLSWPDVQPAAPGSHIQIASSKSSFPLEKPTDKDPEKASQYPDDTHVLWSHGMSSAELAYILFQTPVLIGVHASAMLPG